MKNLHILPSDKPSRLRYTCNEYALSRECLSWRFAHHIYITNDEEIKKGDWFLEKAGRQYPIQWNGIEKLNFHCKKIILTTDQDLIKDGVQAIDDEFIEWFVKNPSCENVEVIYWEGYSDIGLLEYEIIIPKEEPKTNLEKLPFPELIKEFAEYYKNIPLIEESKQETLEEAAERIAYDSTEANKGFHSMKMFIEGAKWQQERMYSEEDVLDILRKSHSIEKKSKMDSWITNWFKQFKKKV